MEEHKPTCATNTRCLVVHTKDNPCSGYICDCKDIVKINPIFEEIKQIKIKEAMKVGFTKEQAEFLFN